MEGCVFRHAEPQDPGAARRASALALIGFLGLCQLVGVAAGMAMGHSVETWYAALAKPPGTPPNWVFGPVWTTLYVLIAIAAWLVWRVLSQRSGSLAPLRLWGWQLLANAAWTPVFFGLHSIAGGLAVLLALLGLTGATIRAFLRISRPAAGLMLPYAAWACYASYLNFGIWWLN